MRIDAHPMRIGRCIRMANLIVMFPTRGISSVQRQQMVSCTAHNVKVESPF